MRKIFVTGIGTDVGKTIISAILTEALQADYWKPVQCGSLELTDTERVRRLIDSSQCKFHPEAHRFEEPVSPHFAANLNDVKINLKRMTPPETDNTLIVEGAGGLMVPFNQKGETMLDYIKQLNAEVVVVSRNYLGSINHSLMTLELLKAHEVNILGVIFNGEPQPSSEEIILKKTGVNLLGKVKQEYEFTKHLIKEYAREYVFI